MSFKRIPVSAIVPTYNRPVALARTLESLSTQGVLPAELIVIDGSETTDTKVVVEEYKERWSSICDVVWLKAIQLGAAVQRNQGVAGATQEFIWFFDDDILFEPDCVARLWQAIATDESLGGVNAMITNQRYMRPGRLTRALFRLLHGKHCDSYAGKCIGPALNILPQDDPALPDVVCVEWLNTGCTIYRRNTVPTPAFASHFTGYSLMEDVALSLRVGKNWKLANARTARIFHDSQPGDYKDNQAVRAEMDLVNRHYVMTRVLGRTGLSDYAKLALLQTFGIVTPLVSSAAWKSLPSVLFGKVRGIRSLFTRQRPPQSEEPASENGTRLKIHSNSRSTMKALIGITTHNRADILAQSIQSALDQDYAQKEVAVFDDASKDATFEVREKFPQVHWHRSDENVGLLEARNRMMRETDAAYYVSLDDDAWFLNGDEVSTGARLLEEQPRVAAIAYDILSPDQPLPAKRSCYRKTHTFIGCGHMLRLSAVAQVGYYIASPGRYGSEEQDLCIRLMAQEYEIAFLPGVHVWHDRTMLARNLAHQHASGVCNDLTFALRRSPASMLLWLLPGKVVSHIRFAATHDLIKPCLKGIVTFLLRIPALLSTRKPVSGSVYKEFRRRQHSSP